MTIDQFAAIINTMSLPLLYKWKHWGKPMILLEVNRKVIKIDITGENGIRCYSAELRSFRKKDFLDKQRCALYHGELGKRYLETMHD